MDPEELRSKVAAIKWWHTIDLGNGIVTPGYDKTPTKMQTLGIPSDLTGRSVLDIGAWDGAFSFEAERRGAERVVAADEPVWNHPDWGRAGFDLAHEALNSKVEPIEINGNDLSPERVGTFDLVFFFGVLYHLPDPLLTLRHVASVVSHQLIVETATDMLWSRRPAAAFYPGDALSLDDSNWWGPNLAAGVEMLKAVGFRKVEVYYHSSLANRVGRAVLKRGQRRGKFIPTLSQGRAVFHAFK